MFAKQTFDHFIKFDHAYKRNNYVFVTQVGQHDQNTRFITHYHKT